MSVLNDLMKSNFFQMATAAIWDLRVSQSFPTFLRGSWGLIFFETSREKSIKKPIFRLRGHESALNDPTMCACVVHDQKNVCPKKKIFTKNFFYQKIFLTKKTKKNISCAETLISPKNKPYQRATFPEGP